MKEKLARFIAFFDARDGFVFIGFAFLFIGITGQWSVDMALIVVGVLILIKGMTKWV